MGKKNETGIGPTGAGGATGVVSPWWVRFPSRLESELRELDEFGVHYERDAVAEALGVMRLNLEMSIDGEALPLVATFPDNYPFFAVQVEAPSLDLDHHQHPFGKALCLLPRSTRFWNSASDGLARLLRERLRTVLDAGATADVASAAAVEQHSPEPFSDYYQYQNESIILIAAGDDGRVRLPAGALCGGIVVGIEGAPANGRPNPVLRGALLEVRDDAGKTLMRAPDSLVRRYPLQIGGRWSRLMAPVRGVALDDAPAAVFTAAEAADASGRRPPSLETSQEGRRICVRAALFPEEHRWRGESNFIGDGWAFAVQVQHGRAMAAAKRGKKAPRHLRGAPGGSTPRRAAYYLARLGRYSLGDLAARAPELVPMRDHAVAIFGLGCLGAPSAFEFARASIGGLRLLDHDVVDPATTVRWPLGVPVAGVLKAPVLAQIIGIHYPYVDVRAEVHQIGAPRSAAHDGGIAPESEQAVLTRMLEGASLVYDASAEWGVQRFLADVARCRHMAYVGVQGTAGGWGGLVVRISPHRTEGCWMCLQYWCSEAEEHGGIPAPPHDSAAGDIHPGGCADPTYAGANVDLAVVALMGVRMAFGALTGGGAGQYPDAPWDVAVLSLRDEAGKILPPTWRTFALRRHPACVECRELAGDNGCAAAAEDSEHALAEIETTPGSLRGIKRAGGPPEAPIDRTFRVITR